MPSIRPASASPAAFKFQHNALKIEVTEEELRDILISAVEGGINYWACVRKYSYKTGTVEVAVEDADPLEWHQVTLASLGKGLQICAEKYPHVFNQWFRDRCGDASSSDVILQCATLGEAVYG